MPARRVASAATLLASGGRPESFDVAHPKYIERRRNHSTTLRTGSRRATVPPCHATSGYRRTMSPTPRPYDRLAPIYDAWVSQAGPWLSDLHDLYAEEIATCDGPAVELGVGNGRVLTRALERGARGPLYGVDSSPEMLRLARRRLEAAGLFDRVRLLWADFRGFTLPEPAALIALPYDSIGHLVNDDDKVDALARIHDQLAPDGKFILDTAVWHPDRTSTFDRRPYLYAAWDADDPQHGSPASAELELAAGSTDGDSSADVACDEVLLWICSAEGDSPRHHRAWVRTERVAPDGRLVETRSSRIDNSWLTADELEKLLDRAGFATVSAWGDVDRRPLDTESDHQIWLVTRT